MAHPFECSIFIPFHLGDPAGILFFGHVFSLTHQAYEQFVIQKMNCSWQDWFQNPHWFVPIRHTEAQYNSPIYVGQKCIFKLSIDSIGRSSFTLLTHLSQQRDCCLVKTTHVFCDSKTKQKMPIPAHILARMKEYTNRPIA